MAKENTTKSVDAANEGWERCERFKFKKEGETCQGIFRGPADPPTFKFIQDDGKEMDIKLWRVEVSPGEFFDVMGDYKLDDFFGPLKADEYEVRIAFKGKESINSGKQQINQYDCRKRKVNK